MFGNRFICSGAVKTNDPGEIPNATFDARRDKVLSFRFHAGVAKLVYALDSKSSGLHAHVGSSPTSGILVLFQNQLNLKLFSVKVKIAGKYFLRRICGLRWFK